ncbi:hypothetical protein DBR32_03295 [Taibaiella sp. KBW10]|uniref:hypothetical protein n=1 Tax=Taibaiella sp. KBW10 TaxID=2153357 RepID=UPI000F5B677C|nr:hypothetical protein [Taibaiella sp. KBW10]RQO32631.1 hypothetical protein DBR32_03295 [Taibaiella sp. KBW10]
MEAITDFFKEIRSRLSNPLLASFAISWLVINWQVPVGLIGYKQIDLKIDGYKSYIDLINLNASYWLYFWKPLIWSCAYTFGFPLIKMCITAFLNGVKKRSDNWNTKILKNYYVPMQIYVKEKERYQKAAAQLTEIYLKDSEIIQKNTELQTENLSLKSSFQSLEIDKSKLDDDIAGLQIANIQLHEKIEIKNSELVTHKTSIDNFRYEQFHQHDYKLLNGRWVLVIVNKESTRAIEVDILDKQITDSKGIPLGTIDLVSFDFLKDNVYIIANMLHLDNFIASQQTGILISNEFTMKILNLSFEHRAKQKPEIKITIMRGIVDEQAYEFRSLDD